MGTSMVIFVGGAAVDAIAALLLVTQAGRESRRQLGEYGRRTGQTMSEWATAAAALFAMGEKTKEAVPDVSGKLRRRGEVVTPRPHALV